MSRLQADLLLLAAAAIWGLAFVFQKTAMAALGPFAFIAARALVAALALAPFALREWRAQGAFVPAGFIRIAGLGGVAFFAGAALQQCGLVTATVTNSGFLTALYVVFVPFVAWVAWRSVPPPVVLLAAAMSFVGTWLLGGATFGGFSTGDALVALSALFWALHLVVTARAAAFTRPVTFTCLQFAVVALLGAAAMLLLETAALPGLPAALRAAWREIAYVGVLSSALTFTVLSAAMRYAPPGEAAILVSTEVLFAALAGAVLLGERLSPIGWAGAAVITAAILLAQWAAHGRAHTPANAARTPAP